MQGPLWEGQGQRQPETLQCRPQVRHPPAPTPPDTQPHGPSRALLPPITQPSAAGCLLLDGNISGLLNSASKLLAYIYILLSPFEFLRQQELFSSPGQSVASESR